MILPQPNLKAKDLPQDYLPNKEILKAYKDANQEFDFDSNATVHDRVYRWFWVMINGNVRIKEQKIDQEISTIYRIKNSDGEFIIYHILLSGLNHKGEPVDFSDLIGKIDKIPVFERKVDDRTGEVESGPIKQDHRTIYTIPFSSKKLDELLEFASDNISFAIKGKNTANRTLSCSLEEIRDMEWDELVAAKTSYQKSDEYRLKQLLEANQQQVRGGVR